MYIDFPKVEVVIQGMEQIKIPPMVRIRQKYDDYFIKDLPSHIRLQMNILPDRKDYKGKRICITAGSRGIPHLDVILKAICDQLKAWGAKPFIIPAMGSHGGGTAQGQLEILAGYNVTKETIGVPVISSMEVVQYGTLDDGTPLYCDRYAYQSDGIVLLNKIKPHTDFRGEHESGLAKMIAIGISKHKGASAFHRMGFSKFAENIPRAAECFIDRLPVAFGVGIVQNAYDDIYNIDIIPKEQIMAKDKELLVIAKEKLAKFKFKDLDVLIIDEIGKNISGFGFDPNVVGRTNGWQPGFSEILNLQKLFIRGLTEQSHHNGSGISEADITTGRCINSIDWSVTWTNIITSTRICGGRIPMYMNNDREALLLAIKTCNGVNYDKVKIARIKNTLELYEIEVSLPLYEELKDYSEVKWLQGPYELKFDNEGFMLPLKTKKNRIIQ